MSKQTALEWLLSQPVPTTKEQLDKARQMEIWQIKSAYMSGFAIGRRYQRDYERWIEIDKIESVDEDTYFEKTYGKSNCGPVDPNIKSHTIFNPATGKIYFYNPEKGGEQ